MLVKNQNNKNKGQVLVIVALSLVLFIGVAALAIDVGYFYHTKNQLQGAADAAALAGAAKLDGTNNTTQVAARAETVKYAGLNNAAGGSVLISSVANGSVNTLAANNDIEVGKWNGISFSNISTPINAVKARARRTADSLGGGVTRFFGRIFRSDRQNISAEAIAMGGEGLSTPALTICTRACSVVLPPSGQLFDIQNSTPPAGVDYGIAWTIFSDAPNTPAQKIRDLIDGTQQVDMNQMCLTLPCIRTNNGVTEGPNYLGEKFRDINFNPTNKTIIAGTVTEWRVGVAIVNYGCDIGPGDPGQGCPPALQGPAEPYHFQQWARVTIIKVCDNSNTSDPVCTNKGIVISKIECVECGSSQFNQFFSNKPRLVK